jgi:hypothetical protein
MKTAKWLLVLAALCFGQSQAMEGVFDRSAETAHYIEQINITQSQGAMIEVLKPIYVSGIGDEQLAKALGERLLRDLPKIDNSRVSSQYGAWIVKALASTGTEYATQVITEVSKKTSVRRVLLACDDKLHEIDWERRKNEIMASRANYNEGDDMKVAQLMNLLKYPDFTYKQNAAYRMSWDKILDPRLMAEIARQLQEFVDRKGVSHNKAEIVAMSHFVKMLGYSYDAAYRPLLIAVKKSQANSIVIGQVGGALEKLK